MPMRKCLGRLDTSDQHLPGKPVGQSTPDSEEDSATVINLQYDGLDQRKLSSNVLSSRRYYKRISNLRLCSKHRQKWFPSERVFLMKP